MLLMETSEGILGESAFQKNASKNHMLAEPKGLQ
jgi:hypothetical protein